MFSSNLLPNWVLIKNWIKVEFFETQKPLFLTNRTKSRRSFLKAKSSPLQKPHLYQSSTNSNGVVNMTWFRRLWFDDLSTTQLQSFNWWCTTNDKGSKGSDRSSLSSYNQRLRSMMHMAGFDFNCRGWVLIFEDLVRQIWFIEWFGSDWSSLGSSKDFWGSGSSDLVHLALFTAVMKAFHSSSLPIDRASSYQILNPTSIYCRSAWELWVHGLDLVLGSFQVLGSKGVDQSNPKTNFFALMWVRFCKFLLWFCKFWVRFL